MSKELDILAKALRNLSEEEMEILLNKVNPPSKNKKKEEKNAWGEPKSNSAYENFVKMGIEADIGVDEISKKLNSKKKRTPHRRSDIKNIAVKCKTCGKEFQLPENYPNIKNFVCCV